MRHLIVLSMMLICISGNFVCNAQRDASSGPNREKYLAEYRNAKRQFLTRELNLTKEQQDEFFAAYEAMDQELVALSSDLRTLEQSVRESNDASDVEIEAAARALYEQKGRESEIEMRYYETFRKILQPRQLLNLKTAERKFTNQLVRHRGRTDNDRRQQ